MATIEIDLTGLEDVQFGKDIRQKEFCLRPGSCFHNNGSYGSVPKRVLDVQKRYLDEMESHPDHWFRRAVYIKWNEARQAVADFVGAELEDIVLVTNATAGINTVIKSLKLKPGDAMLGTSLTYHSIKQLLRDVEENSHRQGVQVFMMEVKLPVVSEDAVVEQYRQFLSTHPHIKVVIIDHITSPSSILMPVQRLAAVCRQHGALAVVDGAHAPGQVPLDLRALDADFYIGNMHKWVYTPRGCALLWVRRQHHGVISPLSTSAFRGKSLSDQFYKQGTQDYTPFLCVKQALQFYKAIGGLEKIVGYTAGLASKGVEMLIKEAGLERMDIPRSMEAPNLRMLKMPSNPKVASEQDMGRVALLLQDQVYEDYDVQTIFDWADGDLYLRISTQVHSTVEDYQQLLPVIQRFRDEGVPYRS